MSLSVYDIGYCEICERLALEDCCDGVEPFEQIIKPTFSISYLDPEKRPIPLGGFK